MRDVAVIGVGMQKWGELWTKSIRDIFVESALLAMDDAGVDRIDSMYVGSMSPGIFSSQEHLESVLADYLGQPHIPATRVDEVITWRSHPVAPHWRGSIPLPDGPGHVRLDFSASAAPVHSPEELDTPLLALTTDLQTAVSNAYAAVENISWKDSFHRRDIAYRAL